MPKLLFVRAPLDVSEERQIRKLAGSRHAVGTGILCHDGCAKQGSRCDDREVGYLEDGL